MARRCIISDVPPAMEEVGPRGIFLETSEHQQVVYSNDIHRLDMVSYVIYRVEF